MFKARRQEQYNTNTQEVLILDLSTFNGVLSFRDVLD